VGGRSRGSRRRRWWRWRRWRRRRSREFRMLQDDLLGEIFGGNLIQRTRGDPRGFQAQGFGLGQNLLVVQAELL
jgi:hypothetical protein